MALEPITRQEQIIAGKDLEPITRMEKFLKEYGGGGGASSWNDLDDKPFGEVTTYGDTLTWDGNTEGLAVLEDMFYHVSNNYPTLSEAQQGGTGEFGANPTEGFAIMDLTSNFGVEAYQITSTSIPFAMCFSQDMEMGGMQIKKGIYLYKVEYQYVSSLTINGYTGFPMKGIKQLDNKYLEPFETVGGDTLTWDGNTEGLEFLEEAGYKISDAQPTATELASATFTFVFEGEVASMQCNVEASDEKCTLATTGIYLVLVAYVEQNGVTPGIWVLPVNDIICHTTITINGYTGFTTTKLKEEYMPNMVVDIGTPTFESDRATVSNINYTALYEHFRQGSNVLLKFVTGGVVFYSTALSMFVQDGALGVSIWVDDTMCTVVFTTA